MSWDTLKFSFGGMGLCDSYVRLLVTLLLDILASNDFKEGSCPVVLICPALLQEVQYSM